MSLAAWQKIMYVDTVTFYKPVRVGGQTTSYTLRSGPYQCSWQESLFYDVPGSPAGQNKQEDIFQANECYLQVDVDCKPQDLVKTVNTHGQISYQIVKGDIERLDLKGVSYGMIKCIPQYNVPVIT